MAFQLRFTTRPSNEGKSLLIIDDSVDFASFTETTTRILIRISVVNDYIKLSSGGTEVAQIEKSFDGALARDFQYEILNTDLGFSESNPIPDAIYNITMELYNGNTMLTGSANTYNSKEVSYYNSELLKNNTFIDIANKCDIDIDNIELTEALFLASQVEGIFASSIFGDTGAIYNIFDNLKRKYPDANI